MEEITSIFNLIEQSGFEMRTDPEQLTIWVELASLAKGTPHALSLRELTKVDVSRKLENSKEIPLFIEINPEESMSWIPESAVKIAASIQEKCERISSLQDPKEIATFIQEDARVIASYVQEYAKMVASRLLKNSDEIQKYFLKLFYVKVFRLLDATPQLAVDMLNYTKQIGLFLNTGGNKIACFIQEDAKEIACWIQEDAKQMASYLQENAKQIAPYIQEEAKQIASYVQEHVKGKESSEMNLSDVLEVALDAILFAPNLKNALEDRKKNISSAQDTKESVSSIPGAETSPFFPKEDAKTSVFFPKENVFKTPDLNNLSPGEESASVNITRHLHVPIVQGIQEDENILYRDESSKRIDGKSGIIAKIVQGIHEVESTLTRDEKNRRIDGKSEMNSYTCRKEADTSGSISRDFFSLFSSFFCMFALIVLLGTSVYAAKKREVFLENVIGLLHADSVENGDLVKMYATANLFGRADLIKKSSVVFQNNLTVSNVWIARFLADTNDDHDMKKTVEEFLLENASKTIDNSTWREEVNRKIDYRKNRLRSILMQFDG